MAPIKRKSTARKPAARKPAARKPAARKPAARKGAGRAKSNVYAFETGYKAGLRHGRQGH